MMTKVEAVSKLTVKAAPFLLRHPTLSKAHIAFSYGGNIWVADRSGNELRRLTSCGREDRPAFSTDGEYIAFIGEYGGARGVFVIPVAGGEPRRMTHHPYDLGDVITRSGDALAWTPDGSRILFSSRRAAFASAAMPVVQLFTVPFEGGPAAPVPLVRAAQGSFSPDAAHLAYVPYAPCQPEWKRYRGGQTTRIWIADLFDSSITVRIPRENSNDFNPMWVGDTIYFLSDRNGPTTLFAYEMKSGEVRQIVKNDSFDIKSASAAPDAIVYDQLGSLHLLDLKSLEDRVLDIRPVADFAEVRPYFKNLAEIVGTDGVHPNVAPKLSPTGTHAVFGVRGEILTVPAEKGDIRNLTKSPGFVERDPAWSPDGKSIAYFSDESGEYALHVRDQSDPRKVQRIDLGQPPSFYYSPTWSPDSRKIAYTDKRLNFWYVDLDERTPVRVDAGLRVDPSFIPQDPGCRLPMAWSPDSRWLAYAKMLVNHLHAVFVHSIEQGQSYPLTDGMSDVLHVAFDRAGGYLYFTASTEVGLAGDWLAMSSLGRPVRRSVYALLLDKTLTTSFLPLGSEESGILNPLKREKEKIKIDLEGVNKRIVRLPIPARNYSGLFTGLPGVVFLVDAPIDEPFAGRPLQVNRFDLLTQKSERILEDVAYFELSFSGDKMLYAKTQEKRRQWFIASAKKLVGESQESSLRALNFDSMEVYVDPRLEWRHLFDQVWRIQRDFLYDPGLHGLDLDKAKAKYARFLANIVSRRDLYYLFEEMLGNLTVGHTFAVPLEDTSRPRAKTGLLGADYSIEQGRFRFDRIYEGDPWNLAARSPISEPGRRVEVGEYLLAVDDREVNSSAEVFSYFEHTAGKRVVLTVGPHPDGTGARQLSVVPIDDEYSLRYSAWVEGNRSKVDELSRGRVAYVHLPDCRATGYAAFNRYFFSQIGKEGAIIDARYNNGGRVPDYIIDCLQRPMMSYWHMRDGQDVAAPALSIFGPKVMLINEMAASMGDLLPWMFRKAGIGPLIGKRTWGGLVGHYSFAHDLLDDGHLSNPNLAFYSPGGQWEIENQGVSPDIEVDEDPMASREGRDVQLERAVGVVMELLKMRPTTTQPQRPSYPRYHYKA